ncbi:MAG: flagellar biosynthetic protein FliO [Kiritimatiellae bacterium]|nr:flagellar biosynthetic protein FliO [Kiritimatiellia bacterium]
MNSRSCRQRACDRGPDSSGRTRFFEAIKWLCVSLLVFAMLSWPLLVWGETAGESTPLGSVLKSDRQLSQPFASGSSVNFWRSIGTVLAVLAGLWGLSMYLRRRYGGQLGARGKTRRIRLVERFALDARRSVFLVAIDEQEVLVGAGPQGMTLLTKVGRTPNGAPPPQQAVYDGFAMTDELGVPHESLP